VNICAGNRGAIGGFQNPPCNIADYLTVEPDPVPVRVPAIGAVEFCHFFEETEHILLRMWTILEGATGKKEAHFGLDT
jgi:hypothetical protein